MRKTIYIALACTLMLSSCGTYKKYHRPEVNTEGIYRDVTTTDTTTLGSTPWREVFTDPLLQALIDKALNNNVDLLTAALSVKQAKDMLTVAKLAFVPGFVFAPNGTISSWDKGKASQVYSLPVEASWTVDLFGSLLNAKRGQQAVLIQAQDYQRAVRSSIISGVANCYYTLLMLDKQLEITLGTEKLTQQTYDMMLQQKKYSVGVDESAVQSARANNLAVQASIPELKRQIRETENALSLLLAEAPQAIQRGKLEAQSLPEKLSTGVGIQVLGNRPDVHAKEMALAKCFYDVNRARSSFYPSITITGRAAWTNSGGMGIVNPGKLLATAVGSLVQPIFQHGQLVAQLRVAKSQQEAAYLAWQQSVLNAGSEVSNALALYETSEKRSQLEAEPVAALESNVDVAQKLFKTSANYNYLNVISAQSSLLQAQLSKVADDFKKMQAVVNLYYALGGGSN